MIFTNLINEFKKNNLLFNFLLSLFLLYPISIVFGPALIEITILFSSIIFIYYLVIKEYSLSSNFKERNFIVIFLFITICIASSLASENIFYSLKSSFFTLRFLLYFLIVFFLLKYSENIILLFFYITSAFILICLVDSYMQLILGFNIFFYETGQNRVTGLFFEEKKLGRYLITISPILVGIYLLKVKKEINKKLIIVFTFLIFIFFICLFTAERVSMFYSGFTIFILIICAYKISKKYLLLFLIPIILLTSIYQLKIYKFDDQVKNTIKQITNNKSEFSYPSKEHRAFMITSYKLFKENLLLGVGPKNYRNKCGEVEFKGIKNCSTHPHNIFFQLLGETGILGTLIYIYIFFLIFKKILFFIFFEKILDPKIFFILPVFYFLNPFLPSGNFFNNWYMAIGTVSLPFYMYFNENKK
ncbi:O-antigen ligase family protein [Candidatus Pelagibacter sp.]|nr:O-antigen ligase family protein [Candidatus Pelagibacter sp.]